MNTNTPTPIEPLWSAVVIRLATAGDRLALLRLAELDSASPPAGATLIAELRGSLVAAVSLNDGTEIADPFVPTSEILELLRVRRRQLKPRLAPRGRYALLRSMRISPIRSPRVLSR